MMNGVIVQRGFPDVHRADAAALYYEAFRRKLSGVLGPPARAIRVLADSLYPPCAVAALHDGRLVGVAGMHLDGRQFVEVGFTELTREYGAWSAVWRSALGVLLHRPADAHYLLMDGIAVNASLRGKGVGSSLVNAVIEMARAHGCRGVALDVVDTNPDARRLYERLGFTAVKTTRYGAITRAMGFTQSTRMVYLT
ncbi:MAG: GNAT family N-acetyltransferase [bacterium]|nr:GNAT family N-acetyltransferase [bacterium]